MQYSVLHIVDILGADFIKTSTGKEGVNAILPVGLVMVRAIREYHRRTGFKASLLCLCRMSLLQLSLS